MFVHFRLELYSEVYGVFVVRCTSLQHRTMKCNKMLCSTSKIVYKNLFHDTAIVFDDEATSIIELLRDVFRNFSPQVVIQVPLLFLSPK